MPRWTTYLAGASAICCWRAALAQTTHDVHVGAEGSFYNPAVVSAALNDTINFIFVGPVHSVVQAAWDKPCVPLPGGFDSGVVKRANDSVPPPVWTLKVTNVSDGLWFYCGNTVPVLHCGAGMVGAINPPSIPLYNEYVAAAKRVSVLPPLPSLVLSGQGAFATNSAVASAPPATATTTSVAPAFITFAPTSSSSDSHLPLPTTTSVSASFDQNETRFNKGATIGGSVAGGTVFLVLLALFAFILRRRRHNRRNRRDSKDFFRYHAQTPQFNMHGDSRDMFVSSAKPVPSATSTPERARRTALPPSTVSSPAPVPSALVPQRTSPAVYPVNLSRTSIATAQGAGSTPTNSPPMRMHAPAAQIALHFPAPPPLAAATAAALASASPPLVDQKLPLTLPPVSAVSAMPLEGDGVGGGGVQRSPNIHALAREVAAVLMQSPQPVRALPPTSTAGARASSSSESVGSLSRAESPAPPRYTRASVMG